MPRKRKIKKNSNPSKARMKRHPAKKSMPSIKKDGGKKILSKRQKKVKAVRKGCHSIMPYLFLQNAAKAIEFYKKSFGAKEVMRINKPDGRIGHAELKIGDTRIMLADENPELDTRSPQFYGGSAMSIYLYVKNVDDVIERAVSQGAVLKRPAENMFYGDRKATLDDPYGYRWYVATHIQDVSPAKIRKCAAELFDKTHFER